MNRAAKLLMFMFSFSMCSCSVFHDPYVAAGTAGGAVGSGLGAGMGAVIGSTMANGDIAASALVGGAVGLPLGILAGVGYRSYIEHKQISDNDDVIQENFKYITARQIEIERLREQLIEDSLKISPDKSLQSDIYTGPTIGTYNR